MTQIEPAIPGTTAAILILAGAFVLGLTGLIGVLYGLYAISAWLFG